MKNFFGVVLLALGLVILFTPFTPGSILVLIGLDMLFGDRIKWWNNFKKRLNEFIRTTKLK